MGEPSNDLPPQVAPYALRKALATGRLVAPSIFAALRATRVRIDAPKPPGEARYLVICRQLVFDIDLQGRIHRHYMMNDIQEILYARQGRHILLKLVPPQTDALYEVTFNDKLNTPSDLQPGGFCEILSTIQTYSCTDTRVPRQISGYEELEGKVTLGRTSPEAELKLVGEILVDDGQDDAEGEDAVILPQILHPELNAILAGGRQYDPEVYAVCAVRRMVDSSRETLSDEVTLLAVARQSCLWMGLDGVVRRKYDYPDIEEIVVLGEQKSGLQRILFATQHGSDALFEFAKHEYNTHSNLTSLVDSINEVYGSTEDESVNAVLCTEWSTMLGKEHKGKDSPPPTNMHFLQVMTGYMPFSQPAAPAAQDRALPSAPGQQQPVLPQQQQQQ
eukprot:Hpha_TRINITY_DN15123_c0_g2::TRINITY_DN15123_c0_g2_i1::g.127358::m.127358